MYYVFGLVYDKTNRPELAVKAYTQAVQLNGNYTSALINLGAHQLRDPPAGVAAVRGSRRAVEARRDGERLSHARAGSVASASRRSSTDW